jgi:hypothetical protein
MARINYMKQDKIETDSEPEISVPAPEPTQYRSAYPTVGFTSRSQHVRVHLSRHRPV